MCLTGLKAKLKLVKKVGNKNNIESPREAESNNTLDVNSKVDTKTSEIKAKSSKSTETLQKTEVIPPKNSVKAKINMFSRGINPKNQNEVIKERENKNSSSKSKQSGESRQGSSPKTQKSSNNNNPDTPKANKRFEARKVVKETAAKNENNNNSEEKKKLQKIGLGYPWKQLSSSKIHKRASK